MARRVNTKFLIILTLVVGGGAVAALVAKQVIFKKDPEALVRQSDEALAVGDLENAGRHLQQAVGAKPSDPTLRVRLGDIWLQQSRTDSDAVRRAMSAWNSALEVDPRHMPALERMVTIYRQIVQNSPHSQNFAELQRLARKVVELQPENYEAQGLIHQATIEPWVAHGYPASSVSIDEAVTALTELMAKDPANAAHPYWIARAKLFRATTDTETNRQRLRDEALTIFDQAIEQQPENADMRWRAAQINLLAAGFERETEARDARVARAQALVDEARVLVKPEQPHYDEIQILAAEMAARSGDMPGAVRIVEALAEARPNDQAVRLQLARLLGRDPRRRAEAIAVLEKPVPEQAFSIETALRDLSNATRVQLLDLKVGALNDITDAAAKKAAIQEVEAALTDLARRIGEPPLVLRLRGQTLLAKGQPVQAIQTLERARATAQQDGLPTDYELLFTLARCYIDQGQSGLAEPMLNDILRVNPDHLYSRLLLSQLLLQRNDIAGAERNLKILESQNLDPAQLQGFRVALANAKADTTTVEREYSSMPEETPMQMARKAQIAAATANRADAIRLLEMARAADPKIVSPQALAGLYLAEKQRDKAVEVITSALAADPDNRALRLLDEQLKIENPTPEAILEVRRRVVESITDDFERAVNLFDIERDAGNTDAALAHLRTAQSLRPDDVNIQNQLFAFHLRQRDWAAAEALAEQLGRANMDQANGLLYRYQLAIAQDEVERAVDLASQLVNQLPQFAQSHLALAQARHRQQQFRLAIDSYNRVIERQRTNMEAYRGLIACYEALQQPDDVLRAIQDARNVRPKDPFFAEAQLRHAERYGNPASAQAAREAAVKENPDDPGAVARLGRVYQASARYAAQRNDQRNASAALEKARSTFAGALNKWPDELGFYASLAETQLAMDNVEAAEKTLRQAQARDAWKDKPQPHQLLAELLARTGRIPDAKAEMRQAMLKAKGDVDVRLQLAAFLAQTGDVDAALEELAAAGDDPRVEGQRIEILLNAGRAREAEAALNAAIAAHPDSANLKAQLAMLYLATQRATQAMEMVNEALARDANNPLALLTKGRIELLRGQAEQAVQTLDAVRAQLPGNVDARVALSEAYRRLGNWNGVINELEAALEVQPQNKRLRMQKLDALANARPPRWIEAESFLAETRQMPQFEKDADWMLAEATMWRNRRQYNKALAAVREALKIAPENPVLLSNYYDILLASGDHKQVLTETEPLLAREAVPVWVHQKRAVAHKGVGDKGAALAEYEKALATPEATGSQEVQAQLIASMAREIGVDDAVRSMGDRLDTEPGWQLLAVQLYQSGGRHDDAIRLLEKLEAAEAQLSDQHRKQYLRMAGLIYSAARPMPQPQKAMDAYVKLLDMEPDSLDVLNNLACLLVDTMRPADPNRAYTYSQRAMDLMTRRGQVLPLIQDTHGWVMVHIPERQVQGANLLADVAARDPGFPDVYYHLGVAYIRMEEPQRAIAPLQRARSMVEEAEQNGSAQYAELKSQINEALVRAEALAQRSDKAAVAQ